MPWQKADLFAPLADANTPEQMRAAIEEAQRTIPVVRQVLMVSRRAGRSAEDTYTMLAYHALQQVQNYSRLVEKMAAYGTRIPVLVDVENSGLKLDGDLPPYRSEKNEGDPC